ncbi:DegT/DnrJ/EryC1/StrS family aminotransferase [Patescibacteria group bacterium]|nr:DegT/DnrJ/EryC1/StrS family aminotransferase [Patescibacteria group bacterium]
MFEEPSLAINGGQAVYPAGLKRGRVFGEEERQAVWEVMGRGVVSRAGMGEMVQQFEQAFAAYHDLPYAIATTSGTTALHTAVDALQIGHGDEVIVPDLTFVSTASVVLQTGAKVVFCDIDPHTFNLSVRDLRSKITNRTKAVIVVHLYGMPADMDQIVSLVKERGIRLIEDCAQAHGATISGQIVGTFGDIACYSFYQTKNMSCGEGGMVVTRNEELARRCRSLTRHGLTSDNLAVYDYDKLGYNYAMTELQAAIGLVQLRKLPDLNRSRCYNAALYRDGLNELHLQFQDDADGHVNHCLTAVLMTKLSAHREWFLKAVRAEGAMVNCLYPVALSRTAVFAGSNQPVVSHRVTTSLFNLYTNPDVTSHFVDVCCTAVRKVCSAMIGGES